MQVSLLFLLAVAILLSVQGYYFGYVRPPVVLAWLQQATFIISTFLLVPVLVYVLLNQSGAVKRLAETGIRPYPRITESVGVANGFGENPTWVFEVDATVNEVREFYQAKANTGDWTLQNDAGVFLSFKKGEATMTIAYRQGVSGNTLIYLLKNNSSQVQ